MSNCGLLIDPADSTTSRCTRTVRSSPAGVGVGVAGDAGSLTGRHEQMRAGVGVALFLHTYRAAGADVVGIGPDCILTPLEVGEHVLAGPTLVARMRLAVVVGRGTTHPHHRVDG
jgi:hypothetical protein